MSRLGVPINYERVWGKQKPVKESTQRGRKATRTIIKEALAVRGPCTTRELEDWMKNHNIQLPPTRSLVYHLRQVGKHVGKYRMPCYPFSTLVIWEVRD